MDGVAWLRFSENLRGMVRKAGPDGAVASPVTRRASVKDVLEALGVPHTEIYGLLADGRDIAFETLLVDGMNVTVSGVTGCVDVTRPTLLRPSPFPRLAFTADANVGKLARLLRMFGFDTTYDPHRDDAALAEHAAEEQRVVVSRDRNCLKRNRITYGLWIRANEPVDQLRHVVSVFGRMPAIRPFSRCLRCNAPLETVEKAVIDGTLQPLTRLYYNDFSRCPACKRIYWAGTHHEKMTRLLEGLEAEFKTVRQD